VRKELSLNQSHPGVLLDVGCGHGWFVHSAKSAGWDASGVDPSPVVAHHNETRSLKILKGTLNTVDVCANSVDALTMWHSLEHTIDPLSTLAAAKNCLKPGGRIIVAVPNVKSRGLQRRQTQWIWLQQPFVHIWHYSAKSLTESLHKSGFEIISITTADTWDAQYLFDAIIGPLLERVFRSLTRSTEALNDRFKLRLSKKHIEKAHFLISEGSRLSTYLLTLIRGKFAGSTQNGSELLIVARSK
jgi:2-polyprenyl-3-methyl-5-hydroxy-6-metoxy-1,4-benzoquinol methylase